MSKGRILFMFLASLVLAHQAAGQRPTRPNYFTEVCRQKFGNFTANSTYESNLKYALRSIKDLASVASAFSTSAGSGEDEVFIQYYCRGDIDTKLCSDCIREAAEKVETNCPNARAAVMWYEECTLRYANYSMVGIEAELPSSAWSSSSNVSDPQKFGTVFGVTMDAIIKKAAYENGSLHFATGEAIVSQFETAYCLVQCSPDLNGTQCETCLRSTYDYLPFCCGKSSQWVYVFYPTCQLRYDTYNAFYDLPNAPPVSAPSPRDSSRPVVTVTQAPPPAVLTPPSDARSNGKDTSYYVIRAVPAAVIGLLILLGVSFCLIKRMRVLSNSSSRQNAKQSTTGTIEAGIDETEVENTECVQFDLKTIEAATNSFSQANKLGQGGFGIVYQGTLKDGQYIAVKRLSKNSGQGSKEFKTEVAVVAKLQHRNLVKLVGYCVDGEERLLIYEFLRNSSLDHFLFNATKSSSLTWVIRHKIIQGIARGLHYLHEDSRVKIVHRDLKISNILLDDNLDPKIADFGMAKLVNVDQTAGNTTRVVGTYGYMSPEYALAGRYSTKSDVYSFGVIVLEILSGKINSRFYEMSHSEGLLGYAWRAWNEGAVEKLMDPILENKYARIEAERCLQIGLLCVQDDEAKRPTMHAVLIMLSSNTIDLPPPFSPHTTYINKLSSNDESQEGTSSQQENESSKTSVTLSAAKDLYAR